MFYLLCHLFSSPSVFLPFSCLLAVLVLLVVFFLSFFVFSFLISFFPSALLFVWDSFFMSFLVHFVRPSADCSGLLVLCLFLSETLSLNSLYPAARSFFGGRPK